MHIVYVIDRLSTHGGADNHIYDVIEAVCAQGWQVTIAAGQVQPGLVLPKRVRVQRVRGLARPVHDHRGLSHLEALVDQADVVHTQNVMNPVALTMLAEVNKTVMTVQDHRMFCPGPGKTLPEGQPCTTTMSSAACKVCLPEDDYRERTLLLTQQRLNTLASMRLIVLSQYMVDELSAVGLSAVVIPPWTHSFPHNAQPGIGFMLGGRLVSHKGITACYEAWQNADVNQPLNIAGTGPLEGTLSGAHFLGWLSRQELYNALHQSRALLFASRWQEPFGIIAVEALACGTPVIVIDSGGTTEWSARGCVTVDSHAQMSQAIQSLATDPQLAQRLGEEGQHHVHSRYPKDPAVQRLLTIYSDVAH